MNDPYRLTVRHPSFPKETTMMGLVRRRHALSEGRTMYGRPRWVIVSEVMANDGRPLVYGFPVDTTTGAVAGELQLLEHGYSVNG